MRGGDATEIVRVGAELFGRRGCAAARYAVRAQPQRHATPSPRWTSRRQLGAALNPGATVDLDHPEVEVEVEVRDRRRLLLLRPRPRALGGLPLGVEGRAVCLLSGGFDSAVAAWLMLKRGVELDYVFCNLAGDAYERSVVQVGKVLAERWSYGSRPRLHVIDFGPAGGRAAGAHAAALLAADPQAPHVPRGRAVARRRARQAIVTGEAIGQVSSQTLANLGALEGAERRARLPAAPRLRQERDHRAARRSSAPTSSRRR